MTPEEQVVMKNFKFYDVNSSGGVDVEEFRKAIERIGIVIPTEQDLRALFSIYDADGSGEIDYQEFGLQLYGRPLTSKGKAGVEHGHHLIDLLRKKLFARGAKGIIGLGRTFRNMDDNHSQSLDKYEFSKGMDDTGMGFSSGEIGTLFDMFDLDHDGLIQYDEFLSTIRGPMNAVRTKIVNAAFDCIDRDGNGELNILDIEGLYNARFHPKFLDGSMTEQQILGEWLETFETHFNAKQGSKNDQTVSRAEFVEYYRNVSASIDLDDYFITMMNGAWNMDRTQSRKPAWTG